MDPTTIQDLFPPLASRIRRDREEAEQRRRERRGQAEADTPARQLAAVALLWADAVADIPYFGELVKSGRAPAEIESWDDLRAVPVLTRGDLQDQPEAFVRRSAKPDGYSHTAGSTGTPVRVGMNQSERDLMRVVKLAEWQESGYTEHSRLFLIWGHGHLLGTGWRGRVNQWRRRVIDGVLGYRRVDAYRLNAEKCQEFAAALIRFRPTGLIGYAAALDLFARHTRRYRELFRGLSMGFVLATTEAPPRPDTVPLIEDLFGCPLLQEYGGGEFGQVAFKRGRDPFEVYSDLNYLECEAEDPEEPGARPVLLTTLYPRYTPLVRYRIGDSVREPHTLPNGHVFRFAAIAGRLTDTVAIAGGDAIHSLAIFHCVHTEPEVYNIQMRLTDAGIDILLITAPGTDRLALERRVRPRLVAVHPALERARFIYVDDVETSRAGKRRWCVDLRSEPPACVE